MPTATLNPGEETQLAQTIEMFEVIVQSQPSDTQSLEILKEAYSKLGRESDVVHTSKRIAQAYLQQGQLSSAILEYETVMQLCPDDADVRAALKSIEEKANHAAGQAAPDAVSMTDTTVMRKRTRSAQTEEVEDGRQMMHRIFVEKKVITDGDFDLCWRTEDLTRPPADVSTPFAQVMHDKGILLIEKSLKLISDKSRAGYLPLDRYDVDMDLTRGFPADVCRRWCVMPFDRMSKAILVATANPFNQQAARELAEATTHRLLWFVAAPNDITANLRKAFR